MVPFGVKQEASSALFSFLDRRNKGMLAYEQLLWLLQVKICPPV